MTRSGLSFEEPVDLPDELGRPGAFLGGADAVAARVAFPGGSVLALEQVAAGPIEAMTDGSGRLVATILVSDAEGWFGRLLLRLGPGTEVLSPPELPRRRSRRRPARPRPLRHREPGRRSGPGAAAAWREAGRSMTTSAVILALAVFGASSVEMVEALTIVLAAGVSRGWRSAFEGAAAAAVVLAVLVAVVGVPLVHLVPIDALRVVIGGLLLVLGLNWLRKESADHDPQRVVAGNEMDEWDADDRDERTSTTAAAAAPSKADRQPRDTPAASTMVSASTISTELAPNTARARMTREVIMDRLASRHAAGGAGAGSPAGLSVP